MYFCSPKYIASSASQVDTSKPSLNRGGGVHNSIVPCPGCSGLLDKFPYLLTQYGDASRRSIPPWAFRCRPSTVRLVIFKISSRGARPKTLLF